MHRLRSTGERELPSRAVGEEVMRELRKIDGVAYVRFASVYRDFQDVSEFQEEIARLKSAAGEIPERPGGRGSQYRTRAAGTAGCWRRAGNPDLMASELGFCFSCAAPWRSRRKAACIAPPNPSVGCLIVRDGSDRRPRLDPSSWRRARRGECAG